MQFDIRYHYYKKEFTKDLLMKTCFNCRLPIVKTTGKVDENALSKFDEELTKYHNLTATQLTDMEQRVANIWCEVLNVRGIHLDDNFHELGGLIFLNYTFVYQMHALLHDNFEI